MSKVNYFQRYSARENHITNNSLLMLRHVYNISPLKLNNVLSELSDIGDKISIGPLFEQQKRESASIPDAHICQNQFNIFIETKTGGELEKIQLNNHIKSIADNYKGWKNNILFGLTTQPMQQDFKDVITKIAKENRIIFISITFRQLLKSLRNVCEVYENNLEEIINDYRDFLKEEGLLQTSNYLTAFPVGDTYKENLEYKLYFEPADRNSKCQSNYIGFYRNKQIEYIFEPSTVVIGTYLFDDEIFNLESEEKGI
ncbi:MAG: hypothetical protein OXE78_07955, partial [Gammaproteobacteria bacterium]|nr:hypothetical protein [Gammaproteobacteria bacterium]